ncbi:MAG: long-chain fatty acid--CoA ligase [Gemmatimonadetes bacterium]|nr:long-chain fatty acid--CoA ligase [Gemmatimonadota bacterium]
MSADENDASTSVTFTKLAKELEGRFRRGLSDAWSEDDFEELARGVFRHQFEACATYQAYCRKRGVTPESVATWEDIPAVPATAFKYFDFVSAHGDVEATFLTSGTTRGEEQRGRHHVPRLDLYRASLMPPFEAALLPERRPLRFLSLVPDPKTVPESSLSFMVGAAAETWATETHWLVDEAGNVDAAALGDVLDLIAASGEPVLLLGTALAFVHVLESDGNRLGPLPEGSRIMETGGFKGARRTVSRERLYDQIAQATGVPSERVVNEYGMTELLSQLYEPVLAEGSESVGVHVPPPWLRVRALDPLTLRPVAAGQDGILAYFDLANLGSISHILTEDVGSVVNGRMRLRGRASGAEPRGCSRAMDDLMTAAEGHR